MALKKANRAKGVAAMRERVAKLDKRAAPLRATVWNLTNVCEAECRSAPGPAKVKPYTGAAAEKQAALTKLGDKHGLLVLHDEQRAAVVWADKEISTLRGDVNTLQSEVEWLQCEKSRLLSVLRVIAQSAGDEVK
jgi:hypothetical protein